VSQLYSGTVTDRQRVREWLLIHTKENSRPLAVSKGSVWPPNGSLVSAQVNPGRSWDFAISREISVDTNPAPAYSLEKRIPGVAKLLAPLILDHLRWNRTVTSDDIYDKVRELLPGKDPRVAGVAFAKLAREKKIRCISVTRSRRSRNHHFPRMSVWELVIQRENQ
jgi:hypothetical protein